MGGPSWPHMRPGGLDGMRGAVSLLLLGEGPTGGFRAQWPVGVAYVGMIQAPPLTSMCPGSRQRPALLELPRLSSPVMGAATCSLHTPTPPPALEAQEPMPRVPPQTRAPPSTSPPPRTGPDSLALHPATAKTVGGALLPTTHSSPAFCSRPPRRGGTVQPELLLPGSPCFWSNRTSKT